MADEKIFLKFRSAQESPTLEIGVGEYRRVFKAEEQPFEMTGVKRKVGEPGEEREVVVVTPAEEERLLRNTGFFIGKDEEEEKEEPEKVTGDGGQATESTAAAAPKAGRATRSAARGGETQSDSESEGK